MCTCGLLISMYIGASEGAAYYEVLHQFIFDFIRLYYPTEYDYTIDTDLNKYVLEVRTLLKAPVKEHYSREDVVEVLTIHVFYVTAGHSYAGGQLAYYLQVQYSIVYYCILSIYTLLYYSLHNL